MLLVLLLWFLLWFLMFFLSVFFFVFVVDVGFVSDVGGNVISGVVCALDAAIVVVFVSIVSDVSVAFVTLNVGGFVDAVFSGGVVSVSLFIVLLLSLWFLLSLLLMLSLLLLLLLLI